MKPILTYASEKENTPQKHGNYLKQTKQVPYVKKQWQK
jgi:hypothetical protein